MYYRKNELVQVRFNGEVGVVVDSEDDVRWGWLYQIKFNDGGSKWFKSCEIRKV